MLLKIIITFIVTINLSPVASTTSISDDSIITALGDQRTCEPIKIELCRNLGYNQTGMPNLVGHELQLDAELQFQTFLPLIQYGCSSKLRFFLCSVYTPMCTEKVIQPIGPCRSLCESVRSKCNTVLVDFGFFWPSALNCSKFPVSNNQETMCMDGPDDDDEDRWRLNISNGGDTVDTAVTGTPSEKSVTSKQQQNHFGLCRSYKFSDKYYYINRSERCAHECDADILYSHHNKEFTLKWIAGWSIVCFVSSLATLISFMRSSCKSYFHERIILYLAANYTMYSLAFILRLTIGREAVSCQLDQQHQASILAQDGLDQFSCTIIFVLIYFFGMSSMVWWAILCLCLYLINGKGKASHEMDGLRSLCHLAAWGLPALKTIAILVGVPFGPSVDADELTGLCYVGNQRSDTLMVFVIVPSSLYLALGSLFLLLTSCRSKRKISQPSQLCLVNRSRLGSSQVSCFTTQTTQSDLEKVSAVTDQLKIFAFFFAVPAFCVLFTNFYDYMNRDSWYFVSRSDSTSSITIQTTNGPTTGAGITTSTLTSSTSAVVTAVVTTITSKSLPSNASTAPFFTSTNVPNVELFILKFFMSLIVGLLVWAARLLLGSNSGQVKFHQKKKLPNGVIQSLPYGDLTRAATAVTTTTSTNRTATGSSVASTISYPREDSFVIQQNRDPRLASSLGFSSPCSFILDSRMRSNKPETPV